MIIVCERCLAKYRVDPSDIGEGGKKVRCSRCKYTWLASSSGKKIPEVESEDSRITEEQAENFQSHRVEVDDDSEEEYEDIEGDSTHANSRNSIILFIIVVLASFFLLTALYSDVLLSKFPTLSNYYDNWGIHSSEDVEIYDVKAAIEYSADSEQLNIEGHLVNKSKQERALPVMDITLLDEVGVELDKIRLESNDEKFQPGKEFLFQRTIEDFPKNTHRVVIDIGSKVELMLR